MTRLQAIRSGVRQVFKHASLLTSTRLPHVLHRVCCARERYAPCKCQNMVPLPTCRNFCTEFAALVGESYERAYSDMIRVQQLAELEEVVAYKKV